MQATGNDFVLIDARKLEYNWSMVARAICDRHFGVGSDGLLLVLPSVAANFKMSMFNPDGSEAEACGNGIRCFGKYLIDNGLSSAYELTIETLAGIRTLWPTVVNNEITTIKVNMGIPQVEPSKIPVLVNVVPSDVTPLTRYLLTIKGMPLILHFVSMGNPHAILFMELPVNSFDLLEIGPHVENDKMFPLRTNFEIVNIVDRHSIQARVWERGAGETLSCGSGACAIAVASMLLDYIDSPVNIKLPGGTLVIEWDKKGEVFLSGPVKIVFKGEWPDYKNA